MKTDRSRVHHVCGLVRPENFHNVIARMSQTLRTAFYGPFDRADIGLRVAISMDAGIELVTPLTDASDRPTHRAGSVARNRPLCPAKLSAA
jgi:hypothetical protein